MGGKRYFGAGRGLAGQPRALLLREERLPLRDAAHQLFDLLLLCAARLCPLRLGSGLLAGGALQLLSFLRIFNLGSVCHFKPLSLESNQGFLQIVQMRPLE